MSVNDRRMRKKTRITRRPVKLRRTAPSMPTRRPAIIPPEILGAAAPVPSPSNWPDAFVDYSRVLTPEGGILITYKDANVHTLGPVLAWTFATGFAKWLIENYSPTDSLPINVGVFLLAALINWWLFCRLIAVMRSIEIRADSMILDGEDVFWLSKIGDNWPAFQADERFKNRQVLGGIYGTHRIYCRLSL